MPSERRIPLSGNAVLVVTWDPTGAVAGQSLVGAAPTLEQLYRNLRRPPTELMERVGEIMRASFRVNFAQGGRPPWAPLKPRTVARKEAAIGGGRIPRRTPSGKIPRRLLQLDRQTGNLSFSGMTILIARGELRDSWCVKGAKGNVTEVGADGTLFAGSQLTLQRELPPAKALKQYHILTKGAQKLRTRGRSVLVRIPLARIHEEGAPRAHIPPRPVGVLQPEDQAAIVQAAQEWAQE